MNRDDEEEFEDKFDKIKTDFELDEKSKLSKDKLLTFVQANKSETVKQQQLERSILGFTVPTLKYPKHLDREG